MDDSTIDGEVVVECKPTPHPDAVLSGTCPSPSPEQPDSSPSATETPGDGDSGVPTDEQPTTIVPVDEPSLPVTGGPVMGIIWSGVLMLVIAAIAASVVVKRVRRKVW